MSDFLVNLLRRGAGLPSVVTPRPPDLLAGLPRPGDSEAEEDRSVAAVTNPPTAERVARPGDSSTFVVPPSRQAQELSHDHRAVPSAADGEPPAVRAVSLPAAPARAEPPTAISPASPPVHVRPRQESTPGFWQPVSSSTAPAKGPVTSDPEVRSMTRPALPAPLAARVAAPGEARPDGAASPLSHSAAHVIGTGPPALSPAPSTTSSSLPLTPIATPREAARQAFESERSPVEPQVEPHIEVSIGRIEIRQTPALPPSARVKRREPRGFLDHAAVRRALDRRWY